MTQATIKTLDPPPSNGNVAGQAWSNHSIVVDNIKVSYRSYQERPTTLKESIIRALKNRTLRYYSTFNALDGVSLQVRKGEVFGIIGSNGAGKSTLLRVIAGVLPPTSGTVKTEGKIDSLIQLGAGFDLELNAVENIYLYGSLHQRNREEIAERIPHIIDFAELHDFATTPIKYYSSGMFARLGFSVAIDRNPDILLVDEILGVGDERFQAKCKKVFRQFLDSGRTIVLVTHSMELLKQEADEVGVLSKGKLIYLGTPESAIAKYRDEHYQTALR